MPDIAVHEVSWIGKVCECIWVRVLWERNSNSFGGSSSKSQWETGHCTGWCNVC